MPPNLTNRAFKCRALADLTFSIVICSSSNDHNRKRPLIVFDGSSSHSGPLKVKRPEGRSSASTGITDRLKPPPAAILSNPIRKLSGSTSSSSSSLHHSNSNLKREANSSVGTSPLLFNEPTSFNLPYWIFIFKHSVAELRL